MASVLLVLAGLFAFTAFFAFLGRSVATGLWFGALALGLAAVGARGLAAGPTSPRPEPEQVARSLAKTPVPPVDDATLADLPQPLTACPDCGYLGIRPATVRDGAFAGGGTLLSQQVCPRCGYQGLPLSFEKREQYGAFLRELAKGHAATGSAPGP